MREIRRYLVLDALAVETFLVSAHKHAPAARTAQIAAPILLVASITAPILKSLNRPHLWLTGPVYLGLASVLVWYFFLGLGIVRLVVVVVGTALWMGMFNAAVNVAGYPSSADEDDIENLRTLAPRGRRPR